MKRLLAAVALSALATGASAQSEPPIAGSYALSSVAAALAEDAIVDWNPRGTPGFDLQNQFITQIFTAAAKDGGAAALLGRRPARLDIEVVRFDILSDIEKFFCCAKNEVSAFYQLSDAETGEVLIPRALVNFDHLGRGGFLAVFAAASGVGQLQRLSEIIRETTTDWIDDGA